jgi:hypothetical protein
LTEYHAFVPVVFMCIDVCLIPIPHAHTQTFSLADEYATTSILDLSLHAQQPGLCIQTPLLLGRLSFPYTMKHVVLIAATTNPHHSGFA